MTKNKLTMAHKVTKKLKRIKIVPLRLLEKKLDKLVSQVCLSLNDKCVECGSTKQLGASHVFSRRHKSTRWSLKNVFTECWSCNYRHVYDPWPYWKWYINKFGYDMFTREIIEECDSLKHLQEREIFYLTKFDVLNNTNLFYNRSIPHIDFRLKRYTNSNKGKTPACFSPDATNQGRSPQSDQEEGTIS